MPHDHPFGLFVQTDKGPLWRRFFSDVEEARRTGQALANKESIEFFVFSFKDFTEIARFFPYGPKPVATQASPGGLRSPVATRRGRKPQPPSQR